MTSCEKIAHLDSVGAEVKAIDYAEEYLVGDYVDSNRLPANLHCKLEVGCFQNEYVAIRARGQFPGNITSIAPVMEDDAFLHVLKPRYIQKWQRKWQNDSGSAFIRQVTLANFLPLCNIEVNSFGLCTIEKPSKREIIYKVCILTPTEMKTIGHELKLSTDEHVNASTAKWIELKVPFSLLHVKQRGKIVDYDIILVCKLQSIPMTLYKQIVIASVAKAVADVARFAQ